MSIYWLVSVVLIVGLATPQPAHVYLDPASGSLILQLVLGGIAGLAMLAQALLAQAEKRLGPVQRENRGRMKRLASWLAGLDRT